MKERVLEWERGRGKEEVGGGRGRGEEREGRGGQEGRGDEVCLTQLQRIIS